MEAFEGQARAADLAKQFGDQFGIDSELFRSAPHLHAGTLELEIRIDAHRNARWQPEFGRDVGQFADFTEGLDVDQDTSRYCLSQLAAALAGAGETDFRRICARIQRNFQFATRSDVDAIDQASHDTDQRRHRVCLHRVMQFDRIRKGRA